MQINLVRIGNSKGIRLPQSLIQQCGFTDTIEAKLVNRHLVLKAIKHPRKNWEKIFKSEKDTEDDEIKDFLDVPNRWDEEEWEW
jgi:antitoxin MazE